MTKLKTSKSQQVLDDKRALVAVAGYFGANGILYGSWLPRLPELRDQVELSLTQMGLVIAGASAIGLAGSAAAGRMFERFESRTVIIACGTLLAGALPLISSASSPLLLLLGLAVFSLLDLFTDVGINIQGSCISSRRPMSVMNRLHGFWSIGTLVGGLVASQAAASEVSLQTHAMIVGTIILASTVLLAPRLLSNDDSSLSATDNPNEELTEGAADSAHRTDGASSKRPTIIVLLALAVASITIEVAIGDWASFRLTEDFGASSGLAGLGFVAFSLGTVVGRLGGDVAAKRLAANLILVSMAITVVGTVVATLIPSQAVSLLGLGLAGVGVSVQFPKIYEAAARAPGRSGANLGAVTAGIRVGVVVAPAAVGLLADTALFSVGDAIAVVSLSAALALGFGFRHLPSGR